MIKTIVEERLELALKLSESLAWFESHTDTVKDDIISFIQDDQLYEGIKADKNENYIGFYSYWTEVITNGEKRMGEPYNLKDTGAFYRSMLVKVLQDSIVIDGDYTKMEDQDWWTLDILGLTKENLERYAEIIRQGFIDYARRELGIN